MRIVKECFFLVGQDPDTFFSSHHRETNDGNEAINEEPLRYSYGQGTINSILSKPVPLLKSI